MVTGHGTLSFSASGMVLDEMAARHRSASAGEATGDGGACDSPGVGPPAPRRAVGARHHATTLRSVTVACWNTLEPRRIARSGLWQSTARGSETSQSRTRVLLPEVSAALPPDKRAGGLREVSGPSPRSQPGQTPGRDPVPSYLAFVLTER